MTSQAQLDAAANEIQTQYDTIDAMLDAALDARDAASDAEFDAADARVSELSKTRAALYIKLDAAYAAAIQFSQNINPN